MDDEKKIEAEVDPDALEGEAERRLEKMVYQRELRSLELRAYAGVLEALRASGKPSTEKDVLIKTLREFFNISEDRHKSEVRHLAFDDKLCVISKKINGYDYRDEWAFLAQRKYIPFGPQAYSLYRNYPANVVRNCTVLKDPVPSGRSKKVIYEDDSGDDSDVDLELIEKFIKESTTNGLHEKPKPYAIAVEFGTGNEEEIEEMEAQMKKKLKTQVKRQPPYTPPKSPDITDAPKTPTKTNNNVKRDKQETVTSKIKSRPEKRKNPDGLPAENSTVNATKKLKEKSKNILKAKKPNRTQVKVKFAPPKKEGKRMKESSEETSSADEGENGPMPMPMNLDNSLSVMSPVFSEVIRTSSAITRGGIRGKGGRGRGGGTDRRRNNAVTSPSKAKGGKSRPRTPNQKSAKLKNSTPTSGSRRKSKLNEKLDYDDIAVVNTPVVEKQWSPVSQYYDMRNSVDENSRRIYSDNQVQSYDRFGDSRFTITMKHDDYGGYSESLPPNYHSPEMEQINDGVFKRPLPPSKGPKPWEIKDARLLNHCYPDEQVSDENASSRGEQSEDTIGSPEATSHQNLVNCTNDSTYSPSTPPKNGEPPLSKKQRIKSPLIVNANLNPSNVSKIPLPAPVFSTTLSSVNKKRQNNKPISVVDSLNLHLPTSATASSLAASSTNRRPGTAAGGGCSMFSNSSALIAGAKGTTPGILQQQRKATPHILSNSKVHQRTFLPTPANPPNVPISSVSISSSNIGPINGPPPVASLPPAAVPANPSVTANTVQVPASQIPISVTPSNSLLPFPTFPSSNPASLTLAPGGVPIGQVNRSVPGGPNIIFVQKANGPAVGIGGGTATVPSNVIPLKTPPRAVILRRAQLPRQGNVMILDMQKNQLVAAGQTSPILQTARVLNAPGELSLVNMQPSTSPKSLSQPSTTVSSIQSSPTNVSSVQSFQPAQGQLQDATSVVGATAQQFVAISQSGGPQIIHLAPAQMSHTEPQNSNAVMLEGGMIGKLMVPVSEELGRVAESQGVTQDAQYAQIEAELMQMEQGSFEEIVYEEEVTTEIVPIEDPGTSQYICTNDDGTPMPMTESQGELILAPHTEPSSQNVLSVSGSSTDTASENETSIQPLESVENEASKQASVTKVRLSPMGEAKIASEAISRALSLSKSSPVKKLTFTTSTLSSTIPSILDSSAITTSEDKSSTTVLEVPSSTTTTSHTQINLIPLTLQTTTAPSKVSNLHLDGDLPSTNATHTEAMSGEVEEKDTEVVSKDLQESSQPQLLENSSTT